MGPQDSTLERRVSVATAHTSLYFVTSHAREPSKSFTCETGSVARRRAYSAGGSRPEARWKGKFGGVVVVIVFWVGKKGCGECRRSLVAVEDRRGKEVENIE